MKLIDEKGRILGLFNIVDILIAAALAAVIAVFALYASNLNAIEKKESVPAEISYTIELKQYIKEPLEMIKVGDKLYGYGEEYLGTVTSISAITPCKIYLEDTISGGYTESLIPDRYDMTVDIKGEGIESNKTYEMDNYVLNVGKNIKAKGQTYLLQGYIIKLSGEKITEKEGIE